MWILDELMPISQLIMLFPPKNSAPLPNLTSPTPAGDPDVVTSGEDELDV